MACFRAENLALVAEALRCEDVLPITQRSHSTATVPGKKACQLTFNQPREAFNLEHCAPRQQKWTVALCSLCKRKQLTKKSKGWGNPPELDEIQKGRKGGQCEAGEGQSFKSFHLSLS